jgi:hypothetical protein
MISNTGNYIAIKQGVPDSITVPVILIAFGNVLALYLDVMFAKYAFGADNIPVPYSDIRFRNGWFWNNLFGMVGAKYFAIALMDGIIVYWLYKRLQKKLIDKKWLKETDALLDTVLAASVTTFTFLVYGNFLRFNWAFIQAPGVWIHVYAYVVGVIALATLFIN